MAGTCTAPLVKARLLELFATEDGLNGVQQEWAYPDDPQREFLFFGTTDIDELAAAIGQRSREERYTLHLWIACMQEGGRKVTAQAVEERLYELVAVVEELLRPDETLGINLAANGLSLLTVEFAGGAQDNYPEDEGRSAQIDVRLAVRARKAS